MAKKKTYTRRVEKQVFRIVQYLENCEYTINKHNTNISCKKYAQYCEGFTLMDETSTSICISSNKIPGFYFGTPDGCIICIQCISDDDDCSK